MCKYGKNAVADATSRYRQYGLHCGPLVTYRYTRCVGKYLLKHFSIAKKTRNSHQSIASTTSRCYFISDGILVAHKRGIKTTTTTVALWNRFEESSACDLLWHFTHEYLFVHKCRRIVCWCNVICMISRDLLLSVAPIVFSKLRAQIVRHHHHHRRIRIVWKKQRSGNVNCNMANFYGTHNSHSQNQWLFTKHLIKQTALTSLLCPFFWGC